VHINIPDEELTFPLDELGWKCIGLAHNTTI
jgi:hypothetical protein